MNKQDQLTQVLAQLTVLSDIVRDLQEQDPPTQGTDPSPARQDTQLRCVATAKSTGLQCGRTARDGHDTCHLHSHDTDARESKPTQKTVAENTLTVKANRAGAHVAIQALDDALQAGTSLVYIRSNVGARKVNTALRKRGYTVDDFRKDGDTRVWRVSRSGHVWEHRMGKYTQGQTEHHRQMVKVA